MIYTSLCWTIFDASRSISWVSGRGLGPGNLEFFGTQMALAYRLNAISQGPKNSQFSRVRPHPTCPRNVSARIKNIMHGGRINHRCINSYNLTRRYRLHRRASMYCMKGIDRSTSLSPSPTLFSSWAGIFKQSMGARNRGGIGFLYRPARLHRLAEFIPWNQFLGSINV